MGTLVRSEYKTPISGFRARLVKNRSFAKARPAAITSVVALIFTPASLFDHN